MNHDRLDAWIDTCGRLRDVLRRHGLPDAATTAEVVTWLDGELRELRRRDRGEARRRFHVSITPS